MFGFYYICKYLDLSCQCKYFIGSTGLGNCVKEWEGSKICYVRQPSSCHDLKNSSEYAEEKYSAEACLEPGMFTVDACLVTLILFRTALI